MRIKSKDCGMKDLIEMINLLILIGAPGVTRTGGTRIRKRKKSQISNRGEYPSIGYFPVFLIVYEYVELLK